MILFILFTLLSIASPIVGAALLLNLGSKYCANEKPPISIRILMVIFTLLSFGLPGWIMAAGGYLWFSTSCWLFLGGLVFYAFALFGNAGNHVESFISTALIMVLVVQLGPAVGRARQLAQRTQFSNSVKRFHDRANQIKSLDESRPCCFMTKMVTVESQKVGIMYREKPVSAEDSGWRFLAGREFAEYLDDPVNLAVDDLKSFASRNPEIIPVLDARVGSVFERRGLSNALTEVYVNREK